MSPTGTVGVDSHTGLVMAGAVEIHDADSGGVGRGVFYDEVGVGDIFTFFVSPRRWYAYSIEAENTPRTANTRLWSIMLLAYEDTDGDDDLPTSASDADFRWSRARAAIGGVPGVTGDQVLPEINVSYHAVPSSYTTDPTGWAPHPAGFLFRNNGGDTKVLLVTIRENGEVLSQTDHNGYLYQWRRDGLTFTPALPDPLLSPLQNQLTTRRWLSLDAGDIADGGENQFSCEVCLA